MTSEPLESSSASKKRLLIRLKKIEGQVRGLQRMLEQDRECIEVLTQLSAISKGVEKVSRLVLLQYAHRCLAGSDSSKDAASIESLCQLLSLVIGKGLLREEEDA